MIYVLCETSQHEGGALDLMRTLCECSHDVLKGNVRLGLHQKRQLSRHKHSVRLLTQKR